MREQKGRARTDRWQIRRAPRGEEPRWTDAQREAQALKLVFNDLRKRTDNEKRLLAVRPFLRKFWHERSETRVLTLGEGCQFRCPNNSIRVPEAKASAIAVRQRATDLAL